MSTNLNPEKALIFRIVHCDNLPWIFQNGLHAKNGDRQDPRFRPIGNAELIDRRSSRLVPVEPRGTLSDYVPFYFTPFSIMMFNIKTGSGVKSVPPEEIAILVSSLRQVAELGLPFVFTNGHAYPRTAEFFNDLAHLDRVDWQILQKRDFKHDPEDPGKKDRYQAEALVWKHVPLQALKAVCCFNEQACSRLQAQADEYGVGLKVQAQRSWYF